ncbi:hypothetical protein L596_025423 [Steinernema carpocapsae]|uniref:F-box domain-containing protein n=1 Tax=Steinernema carpocapsae TaxID=34508 RepID=A0A4U5M7T1_STECR|nr:hypothetical protein L596_025423 [Steinernema carpocapsae]
MNYVPAVFKEGVFSQLSSESLTSVTELTGPISSLADLSLSRRFTCEIIQYKSMSTITKELVTTPGSTSSQLNYRRGLYASLNLTIMAASDLNPNVIQKISEFHDLVREFSVLLHPDIGDMLSLATLNKLVKWNITDLRLVGYTSNFDFSFFEKSNAKDTLRSLTLVDPDHCQSLDTILPFFKWLQFQKLEIFVLRSDLLNKVLQFWSLDDNAKLLYGKRMEFTREFDNKQTALNLFKKASETFDRNWRSGTVTHRDKKHKIRFVSARKVDSYWKKRTFKHSLQFS